MDRHPFDKPFPRRFSLGTLFVGMTALCLVLWLSSSEEGLTILVYFAAIVGFVFLIACCTWVLGTFGERQRRELENDSRKADPKANGNSGRVLGR